MTHRSKILFWPDNGAYAAQTQAQLRQIGVDFDLVNAPQSALTTLAGEGANALVMDFTSSDTIDETDFQVLWRAAQSENLRLIYLAKEQDQVPGFASMDDDSVQVISGPAVDQQLLTRIRGLTRLATMEEEILRRAETSSNFGIDQLYEEKQVDDHTSKILLVGNPSTDFMPIEEIMASGEILVVAAYTQQMAFEFLENNHFDMILFNSDRDRKATLDFIHAIRFDSRFFNLPILTLGTPELIEDPLDLYLAGVNDVIFKPFDEQTLLTQTKALVREHRYHHHLTSIYSQKTNDAIVDQQTGLFSYGFLMDHLGSMVDNSEQRDIALTVALFDILNLDGVNRFFGYAAGDNLIRQMGSMMSKFFRGEDLCARYGGEEFVAVLPRTRTKETSNAVRRLVSTVNTTQFQLKPGAKPDNFHLTFGLAEYELGDTAETLIARARHFAHRHQR
jgi:two-component system, cell cycle response regulator